MKVSHENGAAKALVQHQPVQIRDRKCTTEHATLAASRRAQSLDLEQVTISFLKRTLSDVISKRSDTTG